jgi:hypothetical protein
MRLKLWDKDSGYPKRKTLEELGLKYAADLLSKNFCRLGGNKSLMFITANHAKSTKENTME